MSRWSGLIRCAWNCARCWRSRVSSTFSSSSIRGRWSLWRRSRRNRCSRPSLRVQRSNPEASARTGLLLALTNFMDRIPDDILARSSSHLGGLPAPPPPEQLLTAHAQDRCGSTTAEAMARARDGERGPMWFVTSEQTAGRGRRHRPWIAPRGNLASSILEVINVSPAVAATLGFAAGLALEAALRKVSMEASLRSAGADDMRFSLKWPNDVLAGRRKLAGILLEAEAVPGDRLAVVVGIGTNVVAAPERTPTPATSLVALGVHIGAE